MKIEGPFETGHGGSVLMVRMTVDEAIKTIHSLSAQVISRSPNVGRWEHITEDGIDFSIAVMPPETNQPSNASSL